MRKQKREIKQQAKAEQAVRDYIEAAREKIRQERSLAALDNGTDDSSNHGDKD
jgi:hypothetical protein